MATARRSTSSSDQTEGLAQYEELLPIAQRALADGRASTFRLDPVIALQNVRAGVDAVLAHERRVRDELPRLELAQVRRLPDVALAVAYAARAAERAKNAKPRIVAPKLQRAHELRQLLLTSAESLALAGLLPAARVAKIREGRGALDVARDCVELSALFQKNAAALRNRSPVTREQIAEAATLGTELLELVRPARVRKTTKDDAVVDAAAARDALGALLASDHELLRRAGGWLFGSDADAHVPPLASRPLVRKKKPKE
ncbi:hypothetical protein [Sandaracinus amylolyticus]|uniref:Uncharacterized protein n=1 Tax=Sandaracinus amylolyticus TaxID=927083 RepID=A0A0F6YKG5_9BACT|nr:hypothetical protein [Sandaracinus amylolyticus]AKF08341.1 hypothetical protein DB32_005490 [Sandaracinus amylolyticus]